jgi:hypothetical protein
MEIVEYVEQARALNHLTSDRKLAARIGIASGNIVQWRKRFSLPCETSMIKLAELADIDPSKALIELAILRAKSKQETNVADTYSEILRRIGPPVRLAKRVAVILALLLPLLFGFNDLARAGGQPGEIRSASEQSPHKIALIQPGVYIMRALYYLITLLTKHLDCAPLPPFTKT